jgi:hypothetical protein
MVMRVENEHVLAYQLFDESGHNLGTVLLPSQEMIVGPQAGTVLLRRDMPKMYAPVEKHVGSPARAA